MTRVTCRPSGARETGRAVPRLAAVAATVLALTLGSVMPASSQVPDDELQTFDSMPVGAPPVGAITSGESVVVDEAPFGDQGNRAVHVTDTSTTAQTLLTFPAEPSEARRFSFDISLSSNREPVLVAIQGSGASSSLGMWRFMIRPNYNSNSDGLISVYTGSSWQRLGVIQDLTKPGNLQRVTVDASPEAAVVRVGDYNFRTEMRASAGADVTGIQFASSGANPVGTDFWLDNLLLEQIAPDGAALSDGLVAEELPARYTSGHTPGLTDIATIDARPNRMRDLDVRAHVGDDWVRTVLSAAPGGNKLRVRVQLADPHIGERPLTVTVIDHANGTELSTQARAQSIAPFGSEVVATETAPMQPRFPDAIKLHDGTLVVAYHSASAHGNARGDVRVIRSMDQGNTWSDPTTVLSNEWDNRDPKLTQLADGTVLLTVFRTDWTVSPSLNGGVAIYRSTDGGLTFGDEVLVEGAQPGSWQHAPAVELPNGDILQPLYGWGVRVARSTDGGATFPADNEVQVLEEEGNTTIVEPNIVRLQDGELVMTIRVGERGRNAETLSLLTRSFDDGHTWTEPELTDMPTSSHHMLLVSDGSVLVTWGNEWQDGRPTYATRITDPHGPWVGYDHVPAYNSGWHDQANPSAVELDDGDFLVFGYDVVARELHQIRIPG